MGTYFSPRVPEASPHLEMSLGIRDLWGSLAPVSSWESLGSMYSRWGTMGACLPSPPRLFGEPVFLPGFLGVPKTSQSWAISLPREGAVSKAVREGMFLALPLSPTGASSLKHFGMRLGSLSCLLLGALGSLSPEGGAPGAVSSLDWGLSPGAGEGLCWPREGLLGGISARAFSGRGDCVSPPRRMSAHGVEETGSPRVI